MARRPVKGGRRNPKALVNVLGQVINEPRELTLDDAVVHLQMVLHGRHLLDLHRKFFPADFKKHGFDLSSAAAAAATYNRFTTLVDRHLFPCWDFSEELCEVFDWSDCGSIADRLAVIPLRHTSEVWIDRGLDDLTTLEKLIVGAVTWTEFDWRRPTLRLPKNHEFDFGLFREICAAQPGPLRNLRYAVDALGGSADNPWIDIDEDAFYQGELPEWHEQTVRYLAEDWKEAREIRKQARRVQEWVGEDQVRLRQAELLLRRAMVPINPPTRVQAAYRSVAARRVGVV